MDEKFTRKYFGESRLGSRNPTNYGGVFCFMTYFIYILYSETSDLHYVGYTKDYEQRLSQHNESEHHTFTSKHRPWILKAVYQCGEIESEAVRIEKFIKKQKSRKLIERLIIGEPLTGVLAQLVRVPHVRD